jgi:hypothetical protein
MQTTLRIDGELYRQAKSEAARQGVTITRYIEEALKLRLRQGNVARGARRVALPTFAAGKGFPYTPEELKALAQRTEARADRAKAPVKRRR